MARVSELILPASLLRSATAEATCLDCRWYLAEGRQHLCRRFPPQVTVIMVPAPPPRAGQLMPQPFATYPLIDPKIPCGEFKAKSES